MSNDDLPNAAADLVQVLVLATTLGKKFQSLRDNEMGDA